MDQSVINNYEDICILDLPIGKDPFGEQEAGPLLRGKSVTLNIGSSDYA